MQAKIDPEKSQLLSQLDGIEHGFFTKNGGVSAGVYSSLNCSPGSNDKIDHVMQNRSLVMQALGLASSTLYGLNQIHSSKVFTIKKGMPSGLPDGFRQGDAMVTQDKGVALSVLGADCAPVLFAASNTPIVAAAHAGWGGAVKGVIAAVVDQMCRLGARKQAISVAIGPCIHQPSYEVRDDFIAQLKALSDFNVDAFLLQKAGRFYFDLPGYIEKQCERSGVGQVENLGLDTYALDDAFFSFRRNTHAGEKDYGRQISVIGLDE
jgi:YfiH family protein